MSKKLNVRRDFSLLNNNASAYKQFREYFQEGHPSFHNLLWQIMINDNLKGLTVAFTPIIIDAGIQIAIAHSTGGYMATQVMFEKAISYDSASDICDRLNQDVFGLSATRSDMIVTQSLHTTKAV